MPSAATPARSPRCSRSAGADRRRRRRRRAARPSRAASGAADRGERGPSELAARREPARSTRTTSRPFGGALAEAGRRAGVRHRARRVPDRPGPQRLRPRRPARGAGRSTVAVGDGEGDRACSRAAPRASLLLHEPLARALAERELGPLLERHRAAARAGALRDGARGRRDRHGAHGRDRRAGSPSRSRRSRRGRTSWRAASSRSARPSSSARCCSSGSACPPAGSGKTGYSTDQTVLAAHPRPAPDRAGRRGVARALEAALDLPRCRSPSCSATTAACTRRSRRSTAATGRLSAQRPNLQNIPVRTPLGREIRATFVAAPTARGCSRSTTRRSSCASSRTSRARSCCATRSRAATTSTRSRPPRCSARSASELSKDERNRAKAVNFGIIYGISRYGLSEQLEISRDEAQAYIDTYRGRMPRVAEFIERAIDDARERGYARHAARPPPADPRAARAELAGALARRAAGRQLRDPGLARPTSSSSR